MPGLTEFKYQEWLEYRKSPEYQSQSDCPENHFGSVQLEPITAFIKGRKVAVKLSGTTWDQVVRTVTWRDIEREGLDGEPGTITITTGYVACYHWIKRHVIQSRRRDHWLNFLAWRSLSLYQELKAERLASLNVIENNERLIEIAERKEMAAIEAQRQVDAFNNSPMQLFLSGKSTRRSARIQGDL